MVGRGYSVQISLPHHPHAHTGATMAPSFSTAAARPPPHLLLIPYPTEGHLLPLLDLAALLHARGITTTVVLTPTTPAPALTTLPPGVHYAVLRPSLTAAEAAEDADSSLPPRAPSFFHSMHDLAALHDPVLEWARSHPFPLDAVVSDMFLGSWTTVLAEELGIPRLVFCPSGTLALSATNTLWREMPDGGDDPRGTVTLSPLPGSPSMPWSQISTVYQKYVEHAAASDGALEFVREGFLANIASWGVVFNTFEGLERPYLEHMKRELGHRRVWAIGPVSGRRNQAPIGGKLGSFLDSSPDRSVVYVSFGSQTTLTPEQGEALAEALERSGVRFVWCARGKGSVPERFEYEMEGRGMVVKWWIPQRESLSHKAIGSFVTHCEWNSVMEATASGVMMVAWPQTADQFHSARLVVEELGVGVWGWRGGDDSAPDPDGLGRVLAESLDPSRVERRKAEELRRGAAAAVLEGGRSDGDLEGMVEEIRKVMKVKRKRN